MPRPTTDFGYPRKDPKTGEMVDIQMKIWVLTEGELQAARASAELYAQELLAKGRKPDVQVVEPAKRGSAGYEEIYRNELVVECVCRAARDPRDVRLPFFPNPAYAKKVVTSDEWSALFEAYCLWQSESGPLLSEMDESTMDAWLRRLEEGGSSVPLALLSSEARNRLLMHSVSRRRRSPEGSGSSGSHRAASSPEMSSDGESVTSPSGRLGDEAVRVPE